MSDIIRWQDNATAFRCQINGREWAADMFVTHNPYQQGWDWSVTVRYHDQEHAAFHDFGTVYSIEVGKQEAVKALTNWRDKTEG